LHGYEIECKKENGFSFAKLVVGPFCFGLIRAVKDGKMKFFDFFHFEGFQLTLSVGKKAERGSVFTYLKEEDFLSWDNIDYEEMENDLLKYPNPFNFHRVRNVLYEMLKAYDQNRNQELIKIAYTVSEKLLSQEKMGDNEFIYFQAKKRFDRLSTQDIGRLVEIRDCVHRIQEKCAIEILLGNKQSAEIYFNKLNEADKEIFKRNPIYNLLEEKVSDKQEKA
jgi:hypothetical protein